MHFQTVAIVSALLSITCALPALAPRQATSALLTIQLDNQDTATTLTCALGQICTTNFLNRNTVQTALSQAGVFCGGFTDAGATLLVNPIFDSSVPATYSSGNPIELGSYWCSTTRQAVQDRATGGGSQTAPPPSTSSATSPPPTNTQAPPPPPPSNNGGDNPVARVQLEQSSDQFVQAEIPLTAVPVPNSAQLGTQGLDLSIVSATGFDVTQVGCQVFADRAGTKPVGGVATVNQALTLSQNRNAPATIGAIASGVLQ